MSSVVLEQITELAGQQSLFRELVRAAFARRFGAVAIEYDFHKSWNGGWRCRAMVVGKSPLEFALLRTSAGALVALPVPFPAGWRRYGVAGSDGGRGRWMMLGTLLRLFDPAVHGPRI